MRFRWWMLAGALVMCLTLALAACGGGDDDSGGSNEPSATQDAGDGGSDGSNGNTDFSGGKDPCDLINGDDAEEFLEQPVKVAEKSSSGPYNVCTYNVEDELSFSLLIVQVRENISKSEFEDERDVSEQVIGADVQKVDGIGDSAYDVGGLLFAHKGDTELVISAITGLGAGESDQAEQILALNKKIAQRAFDRMN